MIAQQDGEYEKGAVLSDTILSLDSPVDYEALMKSRAKAEAAAATQRQREEEEAVRLAASEEAAERRALEDETAAVAAAAAQLVRESAFAEQQQELLGTFSGHCSPEWSLLLERSTVDVTRPSCRLSITRLAH